MTSSLLESIGSLPPERVLIVLLGAIGDVVRALPLAQRLKRAWPSSELAWAVEPLAEPIVRFHPALDEIILFERPGGAPAFLRFLDRVRRYAPVLTLDLQRHLKSGITSWASRAPVRIGFAKRNSREANWLFNTHHVPPLEHFSSKLAQYLEFADVLALPPTPVEFGLRLRPDEEHRVNAMLADVGSRYAVLWLGSTWPSRQWFAEPTAQVCKGLHERGLSALLVGSSAEAGFANEVLETGYGTVTSLVGRTTLRDLIGILSGSTVAIGPDSGPMHIAAAVGTPVVSLWGATSPLRSAPRGSEALVIEGRAPCVPCYRRHCPIGRVCMAEITAEEVLARVDLALQRSRPDV